METHIFTYSTKQPYHIFISLYKVQALANDNYNNEADQLAKKRMSNYRQ